jgi:hypothetical protein
MIHEHEVFSNSDISDLQVTDWTKGDSVSSLRSLHAHCAARAGIDRLKMHPAFSACAKRSWAHHNEHDIWSCSPFAQSRPPQAAISILVPSIRPFTLKSL